MRMKITANHPELSNLAHIVLSPLQFGNFSQTRYFFSPFSAVCNFPLNSGVMPRNSTTSL